MLKEYTLVQRQHKVRSSTNSNFIMSSQLSVPESNKQLKLIFNTRNSEAKNRKLTQLLIKAES